MTQLNDEQKPKAEQNEKTVIVRITVKETIERVYEEVYPVNEVPDVKAVEKLYKQKELKNRVSGSDALSLNSNKLLSVVELTKIIKEHKIQGTDSHQTYHLLSAWTASNIDLMELINKQRID